MVGSTHGGKSHLCASGADWYAKWGGNRSVRRRVRVANHKTLPFEHDGLRVVLAEAKSHAVSKEEGQCQHGTGTRAAGWHHGQIADPLHTDATRQPLGGLLVFDHLVQTYSLLSSPLSFPLSLMLPHSNTHWHTVALKLSPAATPLPPVRLSWCWEIIQRTVVANPDDKKKNVENSCQTAIDFI